MKSLFLSILLPPILVFTNLSCVQIEHSKHVQARKEIDKKAIGEEFIFRDTVVLKDGLASLKIGAPVERFWEVFKGLNIKYFEDYGFIAFSATDEPIAMMSSKNEKIISMLGFYAPKFITENGIRIGLSVDVLLKKFPDIYIQMSNLDDEEYCAEDSAFRSIDAPILTRYTINASSKKGYVGDYQDYDQEKGTRKTQNDGVVDGIEIWTSGDY